MLSKWFYDESGQALSEYGLLIAVVGVVIAGALVIFRGKIADAFKSAGDSLSS